MFFFFANSVDYIYMKYNLTYWYYNRNMIGYHKWKNNWVITKENYVYYNHNYLNYLLCSWYRSMCPVENCNSTNTWHGFRFTIEITEYYENGVELFYVLNRGDTGRRCEHKSHKWFVYVLLTIFDFFTLNQSIEKIHRNDTLFYDCWVARKRLDYIYNIMIEYIGTTKRSLMTFIGCIYGLLNW